MKILCVLGLVIDSIQGLASVEDDRVGLLVLYQRSNEERRVVVG